MYKVGDKFLCKKKYIVKRRGGRNAIFNIGIEYFISNKFMEDINNLFFVMNNNELVSWENGAYLNDDEIFEHFYSIKELRKKKLERLSMHKYNDVGDDTMCILKRWWNINKHKFIKE